jgi:WD40 repeat protein
MHSKSQAFKPNRHIVGSSGSRRAVLACWLIAPTALVLVLFPVYPTQADPITIAKVSRTTPVDFQKDIVPILRKKCLACHSTSEGQGELVLETAQTMIKGGDTGAAVIAGKSAESLLLKLASHQEEPFMPPPDNDVAAAPLTPQELGLVKLWVDQGAKGNAQYATLSPTNWQPLPRGVNPIYAVVITPDGQYAACGRANQIFIYHVPTGQLVTRLTDPSLQARVGDPRPGIAHLDLVQSLAFNRDGNMLASGGFRNVKLWRRPGDLFRLKLATAKENVTALAVSADRTMLAVGADNEVQLWDLASGKLVRTLPGHEAAVTGLRFAVDGTTLVSSSLDRTVRAWSVASGELTGRLDAPSAINAIELIALADPAAADTEATNLIAIGGEDKLVRIYNMPTLAKPIPNTPANSAVIAVTTDRKLIAIAGAEGLVRIIDLAGVVSKEWKVPGAPVTGLAFHPLATPPEGTAGEPVTVLATAGSDGVVRLWNYTTGESTEAFRGSRVANQSLAFRPNGKQLVSGAVDGAISVWNLDEAASEPIEGSVEQPASVVALSADGKQLATTGLASDRPAIIIFDLEAKKVTHTLLGHEAAIRSVAFSPDGLRLVSGSADKTARIWDLGDSKFPELVRFNGHAAEVTAVAFNSNAQQVISGAADKTLKLWNAVDAVEVKEFTGHAGAIVGVAFNNSNQPVSASADKTIRVWNPANGQQVRAITDPQPLSAMAITRDFARVAVAGADKAVRIYQLSNGQKLASLEGHASGVVSLGFSNDGTRLVTTTVTAATAWDAASGRLLEIVPIDGLAAAVYVTDVNTLVTLRADQLQRRPLRFALALVGLAKPVTSLAFHPNGQVVFASSDDGTLRGFNGTTGQQSFSANHGAPIHDAALSPNGQFLVTAGEDKLIKVWNSTNGQPVAPTPLQGFNAAVLAVAFSADGTRVIGGSAAPANEVLAFNFATRTLEQGFVGHATAVHTVIGLEADVFATLTADGSFQNWSLSAVKKLAAHSQSVTSLAVLPTDPKQLFSAGLDGTIRHWNVGTGQQIRQFNHGGAIDSIAVRPDGQRMASASSNNSIRLWNVQNGQQVAEMKGDLRAKNAVTRLTQDQTTATAKRDATKRNFEAAEKDLPLKTAAAKTAADALTAANKDAETKSAAVKTTDTAKVAAEKIAIEAAAAAQKAALAKLEADRLAAETAKLLMLATARARRFATLVQQTPDQPGLEAAKVEADKEVVTATAAAAAAKTAQVAPAKAVTTTTKAVTDAAAKVTTTQKPYNDAMTALRPSLATQNTASQLNAIAVRELVTATALVPSSKVKLTAAEAGLVAAQKSVEEAKKAATATEQPQHAVAFSPDGRQLASGGDYSVVHSWDAETGTATTSFVGHQGAIRCLVYVSDDELVSGSADKSAVAWEVNPGWELARTIGDVKDPSQLVNRVLALDFNSDGTQLATGSGEPSRSGQVRIWNVADGALVRAIENAHDDTVHSVRFSPDGKVLASCGADKYVRTFDLSNGKLLRRFEGHTHHVLGVSWQGGGQVLASAGADGAVKIWNAKDGDQIRTIVGFNKQVTSLRFIGDTPGIATASGAKIVRIVRSTNGGTIRNFGGVTEFMHCVDVTPDGAVIVAGGHDSVLRIWNGTNGQTIRNLEPPQSEDVAEQGGDQVADK